MEVDEVSLETLLTGGLGDRHKAMNEMIRKANQNEVSANVLKNTLDRNQIDMIYTAKLANHTKNGAAICELLKTKDGKVVSVALQAKWLFTGVTHPELINVEYFKSSLFPHISYHTLCRLVSNLSAFLEVEVVAEDFYNYFYEFYNEKLAVKLLPKCGKDFIRYNIMERLIEIPSTQLYLIYKKDQSIAVDYLKAHLKKEKASKLPANYKWKYEYNNVVREMASSDSERFLEFMDKHKDKISNLKIGVKLTNQFVKKHADEICQDPTKFQFLSRKAVVSQLKRKQMDKYFAHYFPNRYVFNQGYYNSGLKFLKPQLQVEILDKLLPFKSESSSLLKDASIWHFDFFPYLSTEDRIKWARNRIESLKTNTRFSFFEKEDRYYKYLTTDEAFILYQKLYEESNDTWDKSHSLHDMLNCCEINKDEQSLLQLLKYYLKVGQKDPSTQRSFLCELNRCFKLHQLSEEHWQHIHDIIAFGKVEKGKKGYDEDCPLNSGVVACYNEYIKYCLNNQTDFKLYLDRLILFSGKDLSENIRVYDARVGDAIFGKMKQIIAEKINTASENSDRGCNEVLNLIKLHLKKGELFRDTDYLWLLNFIRDNHSQWSESDNIELFTQMKEDKNIWNMFRKEFLKYSFDAKLAHHYIKYQPDVVINQCEDFVRSSLAVITHYKSKNALEQDFRRVYEKIHTYLMNSIGSHLVDTFKTKIIIDDNIEVQNKALYMILLCYLLRSDESERLLEEQSPQDKKVKDIEKEGEDYKRGEVLARYMGTINPPVSYDTLSRYLGGDYLKHSLSSMFSLVHKRPSKETKTFICGLIDKPVSVKKHFVHLSYTLYPRNELLPFYQSLWSREKNPSIRNVLFAFTYNVMATENDLQKYNEIWNIVKSFIGAFIETDKDLFKYTVDPGSVKPHIINEFSLVSWNKLKELSEQNVDVSKYITKLVTNLHLYLESLSDEFCQTLLCEYLNSLGNVNVKFKVDRLLFFTIDYLLLANNVESQTLRMEKISYFYKSFIISNWNKKSNEKYPSRNAVKLFVVTICKRSLSVKYSLSPLPILKSVKQMLTSHLSVESVFHHLVIVDFTIHFIEALELSGFQRVSDLEDQQKLSVALNFGQIIINYYDRLCEEFGKDILYVFVPLFFEFRSSVLNNLYPVNLIHLNIVKGVLDSSSDRNVLLAVLLLTHEYLFLHNDEEHSLYAQLLDKIKNLDILSINIILKKNREMIDCIKQN